MNKKMKIAIPVTASILAVGMGIGLVAARSSNQDPDYAQTQQYDTVSTTGDSTDGPAAQYCNGNGDMTGEHMGNADHMNGMMGEGGMMGGSGGNMMGSGGMMNGQGSGMMGGGRNIIDGGMMRGGMMRGGMMGIW
ncbi:MAG: hypothetical protein HYX87_05955 [Chloroflexi bacterium]|nr:hypothetical protein [Chloroflexota bacterium]